MFLSYNNFLSITISTYIVTIIQKKVIKKPSAKYGDPNKLDFIYSELAFGQLFFVAYSSCLFLADTFTQKFKLVK
ncbi:hypothetical protein F6I34_07810, partial [Aerococcus tenax]